MTAILGISAFYHDAAAALVVDGKVVAAAQEERFSRVKHDDRFPTQAVESCLKQAGIAAQDLDFVGFYDKPYQKFDRLLETHLAYAPAGFRAFAKALPLWMKVKLRLPREMNRGLGNQYGKSFVFAEHHESHAASAFFPSPFEDAAILTLDGVGEWATATWGVGHGNRIELTHEQRFPHSPGLLYSAFTQYAGFAVNSGEYKLMGLAPYGEPRYADLILERMVDLKDDGSFRLDMRYFNYCHGHMMISAKFEQLLGGPARRPESPLTQRDMDIAASIQQVIEWIMLRAAAHVHKETGQQNLCLAGGVALNCVGNGRILREGPFENVWIQPAAGDAGGALGVALLVWHQLLDNERVPEAGDAQSGSLLGESFDDTEIEAFLESVGARYERVDDKTVLCEEVAASLADGKVVGWFQGRMEFGPRALGCRSILGDARDPRMQSVINRKVKFREGFRPFAPIVLREHASEYFEMRPDQESPYMLLVAPVAEDKCVPPEDPDAEGLDLLQQRRSVIPAVTHVNGSARVQTVDAERFPLLHRLLRAFHARTDCPVLVNTSFNLGWEPIVRSPADAYGTFMSSGIDVLCMGNFLLRKQAQPTAGPLVDSALADALASPCCGARLMPRDGNLVCEACNHAFACEGNIPRLFHPHENYGDSDDITDRIRSFYEETPFPNYDEFDSVRSLIEKSRRGLYARRLDETIPHNATVLEAGCGTGQLANFLGMSCRHVIATDLCLNSLRLGERFRREHDLDRVRFIQMNLFRPAAKPRSFDVVICTGVLHHTADPFAGFAGLSELVKPGGHIVIGLYNRTGRLFTNLRRQFFRVTGGRARWIDPILRAGGAESEKARTWFEDQYRNPHESLHTFGEVLGWFERTGIDFVRGVPAMRLEDDGLGGGHLFEPQSPGTALDRFLVQATQIVAPGQKEGGFFVMIGKRPEDDRTGGHP